MKYLNPYCFRTKIIEKEEVLKKSGEISELSELSELSISIIANLARLSIDPYRPYRKPACAVFEQGKCPA
jgi:hypothetical protein